MVLCTSLILQSRLPQDEEGEDEEPALTDEVAGAARGSSVARKVGVAAAMAGEDADPDYEAEVIAAKADAAGGTGTDSALKTGAAAGTAGKVAGGGAVTSITGLPMPGIAGAGARGAGSMPVGGAVTALPRAGTARTAVKRFVAADAVVGGAAVGTASDSVDEEAAAAGAAAAGS